jgi:hypothetical protein
VYRRCKKVVKPFFDSPRFLSSCFAGHYDPNDNDCPKILQVKTIPNNFFPNKPVPCITLLLVWGEKSQYPNLGNFRPFNQHPDFSRVSPRLVVSRVLYEIFLG